MPKIRFVASLVVLAAAFSCRSEKIVPIDTLHLGQLLNDSVPLWLDRYHDGGMAIAIVDSCKPQWTGTFGVKDFDSKEPVTPATLFQIGSTSKIIAAWAVMSLVDEGKIDLDAPVSRYLEQWKLPPSKYSLDGVTVRRLLSHTAGVNVPSALGVSRPKYYPTLEELVDGKIHGFENQKIEIERKPGTKFEYSAGGYEILQFIVEDVTGEKFAEFAEHRVLVPLGMTASRYHWSDTLEAAAATPWDHEGKKEYPLLFYPAAAPAGLYSTIGDMTQFMLAHCGGEGRVVGGGVVSASSLRLMMGPDSTAKKYGLGYEMVPVGDSMYPAHSGSNPGWKTNVMWIPERGFSFIVMSNSDGAETRKRVMKAIRRAM
jgi:CubicO group peptidase (beta-lactamase class C family)